LLGCGAEPETQLGLAGSAEVFCQRTPPSLKVDLGLF